MRCIVSENGQVLAERVAVADSFFKRLKGLMFSTELPRGEALHLTACRAIHTMFMRYPIDVLYLDKQYRVIGIEQQLQPGKRGKKIRKTDSVVELPAGTIQFTGTAIGQTVQFQIQNY